MVISLFKTHVMLMRGMLILDEVTSNVDTQTKRRIRAAMLELTKNRLCFVIAHRLSIIQNSDLILVVRDGNIMEQGIQADLMNR